MSLGVISTLLKEDDTDIIMWELVLNLFFEMTLVTMIFALLGFLYSSNHGGLMTAMVLLWVFKGLFTGYSSAWLYKNKQNS